MSTCGNAASYIRGMPALLHVLLPALLHVLLPALLPVLLHVLLFLNELRCVTLCITTEFSKRAAWQSHVSAQTGGMTD